MFTGYFSYLAKYQNEGLLPISISRYAPKWYSGDKCILFAPQINLLKKYKNGEIDILEFTNEYIRDIEILNCDKNLVGNLIQEHLNKATRLGYKGVIYLCYEKSGEFCHRNVFASFCNQKFKYDINEYDILHSK